MSTSFTVIPEHAPTEDCKYLRTPNGCYWCCSSCNYDRHQCPGCGEPLTHFDLTLAGTKHTGCLD